MTGLTAREVTLLINGLFLLYHLSKKPEQQKEIGELITVINSLPVAS